MNNKTIAIIIIAIIGAGASFYFFMPTVTTGVGGSMSVQFYKDGQAVTTPNSLSFMAGGVGVDELRVTLGWAVSGADERALEQGLEISGYVKLSVQMEDNTGTFRYKELETKTLFEQAALTGNNVFVFDLTSYAELDPSTQTSWSLQLEGQITASATFEDGSRKSAVWPADGNPKTGIIALSWQTMAEGADDLVLDGYWSY